MSCRRSCSNGVPPSIPAPAVPAIGLAPVHHLGSEASAEPAAALEAPFATDTVGVQQQRRGVSVVGPAATVSGDSSSDGTARQDASAAVMQMPRSGWHPDSADGRNVWGSEAGDGVGDGGDSDAVHPVSLLERITAAKASARSSADDAVAEHHAEAQDGSVIEDGAADTRSGEQDSIAVAAMGLGSAQCQDPKAADRPRAGPPLELLAEHTHAEGQVQQAPNRQAPIHSSESATARDEVQGDGGLTQRKARRSATGGPAAHAGPPADTAQLWTPTDTGPEHYDISSTLSALPHVSPAAEAASLASPRRQDVSGRPESAESVDPRVSDELCDPAAPDTPPSKPPPLAASAATTDDAEEQARRQQQASRD